LRLADLKILNEERAARRPVALVTDMASGMQRIVTEAAVGSDPLAAAITERMRLGKSGTVDEDGRTVFVSVQMPAVRLIAIGAVHISQALAAMARLTELDVTIVDPRTAFATPERFPDVTLLADWPDDVLPRLKLDAYTAVALLTHDPKIDDQALVAALRARCFYIGALGSRKTHARRVERMNALGFGEGDLARIHAPIGLDIGAVSPAEIAVSILGEIIASLRRKPPRAVSGEGRPD
jgi:xanthine dehydrogenase accessory factor